MFLFPTKEYRDNVLPTLQDVSFSLSKDWMVKSQDLSLESYLQIVRTNLSNSSYTDEVEPEKITLRDGLPAHEWTSKNDKDMTKILTILTISKGPPYQIIYKISLDNYDQHLLLARAMISSLHFLNLVR